MKTITIKQTTIFHTINNGFYFDRDNYVSAHLNKYRKQLNWAESSQYVGSEEARRIRYKAPFQEFRGKK